MSVEAMFCFELQAQFRPEVFFFPQLIRHKRVLNVFNMTNDTNYRMVTFSDEREI